LQVASAAAAVVAIVGMSAVVGNVGSHSGGSKASAPQAGVLRSTEQELRLLYRASSALDRRTSHAQWAL
jgi:hypothetical protein